jgi:glycosyltransferase involved in cell wall biosynthesis
MTQTQTNIPAIHQFLAGFAHGDAISNEARVLRSIFRSWGCRSEIFCETKRIMPDLRKDARDISSYATDAGSDDITLLHLSIGSVVNDFFAGLACKKAILYHNVTPAHYFLPYQSITSAELARGTAQVKALSQTADVVLADSRFNAIELESLGYNNVAVFSIVLDLARLRAKPDARVIRRLRDGAVNVLFVGRCAPNKRIEDLLTAFSVFQKTVQPESRLICVGSHSGLERYYHLLLSMTRELKLKDVTFTGAVPQAELNAYYRVADMFLCMSEHEGFCIPLLESMIHDVPVLAYAATAVPETLNGSGILFAEKRFDLIAEMMGRVTKDATLREAILVRQRKRISAFENRDASAEIRRRLSPLLDATGRDA